MIQQSYSQPIIMAHPYRVGCSAYTPPSSYLLSPGYRVTPLRGHYLSKLTFNYNYTA